MFILNKASNMITECNHPDVIKVCTSDAKHYAVAKTKEELLGKHQEPQEEPEKVEGEELEPEGKENEPEGTENATEGNAMNTPEAAGELTEEELTAKTVKDLREIAKDAGIQGYANMNKETLVQMILNH